MVENFRPDVKAKLGIDYESLRKVNPRIVYGSISGFGQDGPYHKRPGFDQIAQGMGGLMSITGAPGEGPMRVGIPVADLTAGLFCAMGILTALLERDVSGEGQWVQTSLLQAQIFMLDFQASRWLMEKDVAKQAGNNHPTSIPTGVFKTSDGYINIATTGGRIWERCAQAIGAPELVTNPDYATSPARSKNRDALNEVIGRLTEKKSTETWVKELNEAGVPCGPIYSIDQMFDDAQVKHLGIAQHVPNDENRHIQLVGQPVTLSRTPSSMAARPPEFGEQTEEVLAEFGFGKGRDRGAAPAQGGVRRRRHWERSDEAIHSARKGIHRIASRRLSSGAHSRDPLARNDAVRATTYFSAAVASACSTQLFTWARSVSAAVAASRFSAASSSALCWAAGSLPR